MTKQYTIHILNDDYNYRPGFFDTPALLYTPIQPARAQKCSRIKKDTSVVSIVSEEIVHSARNGVNST